MVQCMYLESGFPPPRPTFWNVLSPLFVSMHMKPKLHVLDVQLLFDRLTNVEVQNANKAFACIADWTSINHLHFQILLSSMKYICQDDLKTLKIELFESFFYHTQLFIHGKNSFFKAALIKITNKHGENIMR